MARRDLFQNKNNKNGWWFFVFECSCNFVSHSPQLSGNDTSSWEACSEIVDRRLQGGNIGCRSSPCGRRIVSLSIISYVFSFVATWSSDFITTLRWMWLSKRNTYFHYAGLHLRCLIGVRTRSPMGMLVILPLRGSSLALPWCASEDPSSGNMTTTSIGDFVRTPIRQRKQRSA